MFNVVTALLFDRVSIRVLLELERSILGFIFMTDEIVSIRVLLEFERSKNEFHNLVKNWLSQSEFCWSLRDHNSQVVFLVQQCLNPSFVGA